MRKVALCAVVLAMTGFMSWGGYCPALAFVNRVMVFNLVLLADASFAEIAGHTAIPA
jgi:hypothetical protein